MIVKGERVEGFNRPHDRRCERCEKLFIASKQDQRRGEYKCEDCRQPVVRVFSKGGWK